jgi:UDPglucose--hexose-1-phosphate uridylyltransferase
VIVETPRHGVRLADMAPAQLGLILRMYRERFRALAIRPGVREVVLFKNEGEAAGASLAHAHAQVVGLPLQSPLQRRRLRVARDHFRRHGVGPCQALRVLLHPYASRALHETWLIPTVAGGSLAAAGDGLLDDAAGALAHATRLLRAAVGPAAFNVVLHSAMPRDAARPELLWYLQLIPRLTRNAGFEFTSGLQLSAAQPEATAAQWRELAGQLDLP